MLITLSGVDGAGKSTQIDLLRSALAARGHRVKVLWYRPGYSRRLDALRALVRRVRPGLLPHKRDGIARGRAFERPHVRVNWVMVALIDLLTEYAVGVRARLATGATVICDRYLEDAALDLCLRFPELVRDDGPLLAAIRALCPSADHAFLLMVPVAEMSARLERKDEPFPDPEAVRALRHAAYRALANRGALTVIDAARPAELVHADILQRVLSTR